jgi:hypothetical protein
MELTKKGTSGTVPDIGAKADKAIATLKAAAAVAQKAAELHNAVRAAVDKSRGSDGRTTDENRLKVIVAEREMREADHARKVAAAVGSLAQDAADVAAGDPLALACDPQHFHDALLPLIEELERKRVELAEAEELVRDRIDQGIKAWEALNARRVAERLPSPVPLARPTSLGFNGQPRPSEWLSALIQGVGRKFEPQNTQAHRLWDLRREETEIRASLEQARLDREEAAAEAARQREAERRDSERRTRADRKERESEVAKLQAERDRISGLAEAHRQRECVAR